MKKHLQTAICFLLLLSMVFVFAACTTEGGDTGSGSGTSKGGAASGDSAVSGEPGSEYMNADGFYIPKKGVLDEYKGRTFTILVVGAKAATYQSDDFTTEAGEGGIDYGDSYYVAVGARNDRVEEIYDITLDVQKIDSPMSVAQQDELSGTKLFDAVILDTKDMCALAQQGYLCDLNTLQNIDLNAPWWNASANEAFSIGEKLFFTTGDITIMDKATTAAILFLKQVIVDYQLESPYTLFKEGKWTFDKMVEMCAAVGNATATSDWQDPNVIYGMTCAQSDILQFYAASGQQLCEKDAANEPSLLFGKNEASINLTEKILNTFNDATWKLYAQDCTNGPNGNIWEDNFSVFYNGRCLLRPSGFTAVAKMRLRSDIEFGIVPMPRMTEDQEYSVQVPNNGFGAGILQHCKDPEFSAYMLDAFAAASKYDGPGGITYEYLETTLKGKNYMDNESREMVDYIFNNLVYDIGRVYGFGGLPSMFETLAKNKSSDVRSSFEQIQGKVETAIEETVADYKANN